MKTFIKLLTLSIIFSIFNYGTLSAQTNSDGVYVVYEEVYFFNEIDYAFYQCYNEFLMGDDSKSSIRLKRAAYFVALEAQDAKAHNKKPIEKQAQRLESLADSLSLGRITSAWELRRAFARTHNVIANQHYVRAAAYWTGKETQNAGRAMINAAGYLGHAAQWSGRKIEKGVVGVGKGVATGAKATGRAVSKGAVATAKGAETVGVESVRGVRWIGGKLIKGIGFVPEKVGQGIEWLGSSIKQIGDEVEPVKKIK